MCRGVHGIQAACIAHRGPNGQRFTACACTKIDHHFAAVRIKQKCQQLRAFILDFNRTAFKGFDFGQRRLALQTQTPRRVWRGLAHNAGCGQFHLHLSTLFVQVVDAQIQSAWLQKTLGQGFKLITQLLLERTRQPIGQVVNVLRHQVGWLNAVAHVEPFFFGVVECAFDKVARACKAQNGKASFFGTTARASHVLKQQFFSQNLKHRLGQSGTLTRTQIAVIPKKPGHHRVGRMVKLQGEPDQFGAGV